MLTKASNSDLSKRIRTILFIVGETRSNTREWENGFHIHSFWKLNIQLIDFLRRLQIYNISMFGRIFIRWFPQNKNSLSLSLPTKYSRIVPTKPSTPSVRFNVIENFLKVSQGTRLIPTINDHVTHFHVSDVSVTMTSALKRPLS